MDHGECFVFSDLAPGTPLVGRLRHEQGKFAQFRYAKPFVNSGQSFSIDPINVPLSLGDHTLQQHPFMFGAFLDAGPDDWGRKVLLKLGKRADGIGPLLFGAGLGVGSLRFSLSRDACKPRPIAPEMDGLAELLEAAYGVEHGDPLPPHLQDLLDAGTSMGGARPKAVVRQDGQLWLAKFPSQKDAVDQPVLEYATLRLARQAGITVPDHRIVRVGGKNVLLVSRFDIPPAGSSFDRYHYVSMCALLVAGRKARPDDAAGRVSYMGMATVLKQIGERFREDASELFTRMVFNVLVGHVDDHSRNHGFLLRKPGGQWALAPSFDMAPSNGTAESLSSSLRFQAIGIGKQGVERTYENLMSAHLDFGLKREEAEREYERVHAIVSQWRSTFSDAGVSGHDQELVARRFLQVEPTKPSVVVEETDGPQF